MAEVQNDPDRVVHPLRRREDGSFERVTWPEALDEIGARLGRIRDRHGGDAVGWYMGNPGAFSYSHPLWVKGFLDALGSPHSYTASSQDVSNRFAASSFLYGSPFIVPIPDLARTDFLLMVGANPLVSHGSVLSAPRVKDQLHAITAQGGRIVVVDPRRSETAAAFEHLAVHPDSDAWLLLSLLQVIFASGLEDDEAIRAQATGIDGLRELCAEHTPERTEPRTGVPASEVRRLAEDLAGAERAAVYGRTGSCLGRNGTLVAFLLDALNVVTGNLDREGGAMFGDPPIDFGRVVEMVGLGTYGKVRSRVGDLPEVLGSLPASVMAKEITTPGKGQIRAMFFSAGNPVLSVPNGDELEAAMAELELSVAIDLYVTDTSRHCDFVLPATTMYEREDFPLPFLALFDAVRPDDRAGGRAAGRGAPGMGGDRGDRRPDRRRPVELLAVAPARAARHQALAAAADRPAAAHRAQGRPLRPAPGGLSIAELERNPHGMVLAEHLAPDVLGGQIRNETKLVRLDPPEIAAEARRLEPERRPSGLPPAADRPARAALTQLLDAQLRAAHAGRSQPCGASASGRRRGLRDRGRRELPDQLRARLDRAPGAGHRRGQAGDDRGPARWGHRGGWRLAAAAGGANVNLLSLTPRTSSGSPEWRFERHPGPLEPVGAQRVDEPATAVEAPA